ncbi:hypothetical protein ACTXT7_017555 [Hymenolepis weldensis]
MCTLTLHPTLEGALKSIRVLNCRLLLQSMPINSHVIGCMIKEVSNLACMTQIETVHFAKSIDRRCVNIVLDKRECKVAASRRTAHSPAS